MAVLEAAEAALARHLQVSTDELNARCICGWTGPRDQALRHIAAQVIAAAFRTSNPDEVREAVEGAGREAGTT